VFLSLAGTIDSARFDTAQRIGVFSYGSGCCSEFYSGVATPEGQRRLRAMRISRHLDDRHSLSIEEYERLLTGKAAVAFGTRNWKLDESHVPGQVLASGLKGRLVLERIHEFHREYRWN
jgi:polyketide biosynthesis 3-hydroxy-3-methylglutaryl-CoA synthase-like enzyme PksG